MNNISVRRNEENEANIPRCNMNHENSAKHVEIKKTYGMPYHKFEYFLQILSPHQSAGNKEKIENN